jgi:murein DD-endopeptidase MepM/ murein hydrolase activator NlpD
MADKELTGKELKQNLTQAKKDAADIAKSSKTIKDSLADAAKSLTKFGGVSGVGTKLAGAVLGQRSMGYGNTGGMPGPADLQNSLFRPGVGLSDFTNFAAGMSKGFSNFLPDVSSTIQRAGTYYNATIMGGFRGAKRISRGEVENATYGTLSSMMGITSSGSSANVANIFANQGMTAGSDTYTRNVRAVGNAARYLNMSNETAAAAIGGLGTGAMSANIMRNFGIYTTDPITGKERSMAEIFEDLAGRMERPGANATAEDVQNSIRKGALGANIAASGLSADQQQLFKQYMIERATGNKMDLSDQGQMKKLMDAQSARSLETGLTEFNENPLNSLMDLETSAEGAEKAATPQYIHGLKTATVALKGLDLVAGVLARTMGGLTSSLQVVLGGRTTQGLMGMANSSLNLISSGLEAIMSADPTGISRAVAGASAVAAGGVGLTGLVATAQMGTAGVGAGLMGGSGANAGGPGGATSADKSMGSDTGSISDMFGGLDKGGVTLGASGGNSFSPPLKGTLTTSGGYKYGEVEKAGNGTAGQVHDGIDYAAGKDTDVFAVTGGTIAGCVYDDPENKIGDDGEPIYSGTTYGNYVKIDHGVGKNGKRVYSLYAHLLKGSTPSSLRKKGAKVKAGEFIGKVGRTGKSYGYHLHYEVFEGTTTVDPKTLRQLLATGSKGNTYGVSEAQATQASNLFTGLQALYGGDLNTAFSKLGSALNIDLGAMYGVSEGTSPGMSASNTGSGATGSSGTAGGGGAGGVVNNVGGITVNIKDATPESAKKFAEYVQEYLNNQSLTSNLGSL